MWIDAFKELRGRRVLITGSSSGIRVNCVSPGYIDTPIHRVSSPEQLKRYLDATPLGRAGLAQDCVGIFLLLACERLSGLITGQTIGVNGGMHLN